MDRTVPAGAARLLDFIAEHESGGRYDVIYGFRQGQLPKPITSMTLDELLSAQRAWGRAWGSSAAGRYQIIRKTLEGLKRELRLSGSQKFNPDLQDRLAYHLLRRRRYDDFMAGRISVNEFGKNLAMEWASLPVLANTRGASRTVSRGQSYYAGDGLNKALISPEAVERLLHDVRDGPSAPPKPPAPPPRPSESQIGQRVMPFVAVIIIIAVVAFVVWRIVS